MLPAPDRAFKVTVHRTAAGLQATKNTSTADTESCNPEKTQQDSDIHKFCLDDGKNYGKSSGKGDIWKK